MPKYPERVNAVMQRKNVEGETRLFRSETKILFGEEPDNEKLLGTVFMTNPGSFKMQHHDNWSEFSQGLGSVEEIQGKSDPDPTMRNLIRVIREAYQETKISLPSGYVAIYNISSLVESDGSKIARIHNQTRAVLGKDGESVLHEVDCYNLNRFHKKCRDSKFIILGFLKDVFNEQQCRIIDWCSQYDHKLVFAIDDSGHLHHPYRWPLIPGAMEEVKTRLKKAIQTGGNDNVPT